MRKIITSETQEPVITKGYIPTNYERGLDPFHRDAAPAEFKDSFKDGERLAGWFALDWAGNPIGFIPDGTEFEVDD